MISTRRSLLQAGAAAALAATTPLMAQPLIMTASSELMPKSGKRRVVILGGGWGGLTTARHVREQAPDLEVVVIERNPVFWSCPLSNKADRCGGHKFSCAFVFEPGAPPRLHLHPI